MSETNLSPLWKVASSVCAVAAVVALLLWLVSRLPELNPFAEETVDRSGPAILQSVRDLSRYHAAAGDFQVVVDLEQDVPWLPDIIAGERTLFVAAGSVDAYVDLGGLADDALTVDEERRTVRVELPPAELAKPNLDQERSYVYDQDRGAYNRIESLFSTPDQRELYVLAEDKIADAAERTRLTERAERNTRTMLTGMFSSLGYTAEFAGEPSVS
ncbi:DUF4230 domain-containing protein [Actinophytocola gossypii]|uniref:DUF4230 domain-containing protein n=1 Tax=Actinophytocola gossypii TaxID=2812003 RepID=A0ABT2JAI9_9PSEU|nr:DUF4230 domain-containing protein [Actinophytocola gossypii]MCT2584304.1 DUF4230 domain-containing protein [Actinophytocola gossypii]